MVLEWGLTPEPLYPYRGYPHRGPLIPSDIGDLCDGRSADGPHSTSTSAMRLDFPRGQLAAIEMIAFRVCGRRITNEFTR